MRDVVVIGGGLSGLTACYELEKQNIRYTVIEVKSRFGGSIISSKENGFVLDGASFVIQQMNNTSILSELELVEDTFELSAGDIAFNSGTESLTKALASKLTKGRLMRMAVSSIGQLNGRFTICMENGMVYDAGALIIATPARFAERMFYSFVPEISERLQQYHYDSIFRVSLGYHKRDLPERIRPPYDLMFPFILTTDQSSRVPDNNHLLIQVGVRANPTSNPEQVTQEAIQYFRLGQNPIVQKVHYWSEADPLTCYDDDHHENIKAIHSSLPDGISLIGSDYCTVLPQHKGVSRLDDRIHQGREAAHDAIQHLKKVSGTR